MDTQTWIEGNNRYLSASLLWLRLRLEQLGREVKPAAPIAPLLVTSPQPASASFPAEQTASLFGRLRGRTSLPAQAQAPINIANIEPPLLHVAPEVTLDEQIAQAAEAREQALHELNPPPALALLGQQLSMSPFEQDVLLLCMAMELDTRVPALCARAQGDDGHAYPTFALAMALFDSASWDALSPHQPLRDLRLIEINQPGATPLTLSTLRADERIVNYLKGLNEIDDRLMLMLTPVAMDAQPSESLAPSQQALAAGIVNHWKRTVADESLPVAQLLGMDAAAKDHVAAAAAQAAQRRLYRVSAKSLPQQPAELDAFARLWQRESLLTPLALLIDAHAGDLRPDELAALIDRLLKRDLGFVLISLRDAPARINHSSFVIDVAQPTAAEQQAAWVEALVPHAGAVEAAHAAQVLAGQFNLNLPDLKRLADEVLASEPVLDATWDACRAMARPQLDALAQRIDAKATWDDLVLPNEQTKLLHQIADQVRNRMQVYSSWGFGEKMNRGLGISALFAGYSGTGKTMAAEVIANDLRLNLYRIDLSAVVSKYIGETEKNLRQVFDAAEHGGAILFFDEADSLFGKRSEVKDSHDRYANIEINYLLQRMESYSGLAILATNMKSALDDAFMRRLRFIVDFPYPGQIERKRMWEKAFPAGAPTHELDMGRLARLNLTGGNIHSIALNAAFLAAARDPAQVSMAVVLEAVRAELRKLGKPVNEAELRV